MVPVINKILHMNPAKYKLIIYFLTGGIIGFLASTIVMTIIISNHIESYHQIIKQLESNVVDKETRLQKLEESLYQAKNEQQYILKEVKIQLLCEDEIDKITFIQHIKQKYTILLGKELNKIDMDIIDQVIDRRIFKVKDKEYQLFVKKVTLTDILSIWIEAVVINEND